MKKILFSLFTLLATTSFAQPCNTCPAKNPQAQILSGPAIFTPVTVGTTANRVAYLKEAPSLALTPFSFVAYIYMLDQNGNIVESGISVQMKTGTVPADWNGTFVGKTINDIFHPVTYPKRISISVKMEAIQLADGSITAEPEISYRGS